MTILIALLTWIAFNVYAFWTDHGSRLHRILRRDPGAGVEVLAAAAEEGMATQDISGAAIVARKVLGLAVYTRFLWVGIVTGTLVLTTMSPALLIAIGTLGCMVSGARMQWAIRLKGHHDHSWRPTALNRLSDAFAYGVKGVIVAGGFTLLWLSGQALALGDRALWILSPVGGILLIRWAHLPARAVIRVFSRGGAQASGFGETTDSDSIMFLRSFDDDAVRVRAAMVGGGPANPVLPAGKERFEELIAYALLNQGRLVAIGRPGQKLPELGAVRTYYPDDDWQQAVRMTAQRCSRIVLVAGTSAGLGWEIDHLRRWGVLDKCLFILPPDDDYTRAERRYSQLRLHLTGDPEIPYPWVAAMWVAVQFENGSFTSLISDGYDYAAYVAAVARLHPSIARQPTSGTRNDWEGGSLPWTIQEGVGAPRRVEADVRAVPTRHRPSANAAGGAVSGPSVPAESHNPQRSFPGGPPTMWDVGLPGSATATTAARRPDGCPIDGPLTPRDEKRLRRRLIAGVMALQVSPATRPLGRVLVRCAIRVAKRAGAPGAALTCRFVEIEVGRHGEWLEDAEPLLRRLASEPEPGWITVADTPCTGADLLDEVWNAIAEEASDRGDHQGVFEAEIRRSSLVNRMTDPAAARLSAARLGFALSRTGQVQEALASFERAEAAGPIEHQTALMWAATHLAAGQVDEAEKRLWSMPTTVDFTGFLGLQGDLAAAQGEFVEAAALYRRALGASYKDLDPTRRNRQMLEARLSRPK